VEIMIKLTISRHHCEVFRPFASYFDRVCEKKIYFSL